MRLITAEELAIELSITTARTYDLARQGLIPCIRLGRQIRFDPLQIEKWLSGGGQALEEGWRHNRETQLRIIRGEV